MHTMTTPDEGPVVSSDRVRSAPSRLQRLAGGVLRGLPRRRRSRAILFDREGALVAQAEPADHASVEPAPGAANAVAAARAAGVAVGVLTSPRGASVPSGDEGEKVNARVDELVGPVDLWLECTHAPEEECPCRLPAPGLIYLAAAALGTRPERCVVVGDVGESLEAARAAGARAVLVPSARTTREDLDAAPMVAADVEEAVALALRRAA
jgi:HAD superfamily hydrolase (TIGR01662 family)